MDQSQTQSYVSRFEPLLYVPTFTRRIFTITSTQDFSHRKPPLRIWVIQTWSTQLLSQKTTSTQKVRHKLTQDQPFNRVIDTKPKLQPQLPLHLEGYQHNLHNHLYSRGILKAKKRLQHLVVSTNHKPIFSPK